MRLFPILAALFLVVPIVEIYLLIQVGQVIGALPTIALVVLTAVAGAWLLRQQGLATLARFQANLERKQLPAFELIEAMVLLMGGVLLLTPGFMTDIVGILCLLPPTRHVLVRVLLARVKLQVVSGRRPRARGAADGKGQVIEGEVTRRDDA